MEGEPGEPDTRLGEYAYTFGMREFLNWDFELREARPRGEVGGVAALLLACVHSMSHVTLTHVLRIYLEHNRLHCFCAEIAARAYVLCFQ
eukprot:4387518-Amphidinium_carterae.1